MQHGLGINSGTSRFRCAPTRLACALASISSGSKSCQCCCGVRLLDMRAEVEGTVVAAATRMTRLMMRARRPAERGWLEWYRRTWWEARSIGRSALIVGVCAEGAVARLAARFVCSVLSTTLCWGLRPVAGVNAARAIAGGRLGAWTRRGRIPPPWASAPWVLQ